MPQGHGRGCRPERLKVDTLRARRPGVVRRAGPRSPPLLGRASPKCLALPSREGFFMSLILGIRSAGAAYSAALATRAASASSKASMRRAVCCGDFVNRASRL